MYSHIIMDLDGTLLNSKGEISEYTLMTILECKKKGVGVILCSGRHLREIIRYVKTLKFNKNDYIICCDGQYIYDNREEIIYEGEFLTWQDILKIQSITQINNFSFFTDKKNYYFENRLFYKQIKYIVYVLIKRKNIAIVNSRTLIDENEKFYKAAITCENHGFVNELKKYYNVNCLNNKRIEILNFKVSKYIAIMNLSKVAGFDVDNVLYFGDDDNDFDCFLHMKNCIAMGNASDSIKKIACMITDTCDDEGIGKALSKLILNSD